ncbi:unnamed protein product [Paramecium sonneborni]|uniref:RING-type domain-containing protein n=1 Tax=Paramecium sonneborni TaxID=65129 RepID=A0A8S1P9J1_9CILI|nr:unnamed protein product [Paramecium sonneborni]
MQWELLPSDVNDYSPRTGHTVIAYKDCIYVFGGIDEQDRQNDMYKYQKGWTKLKLQGEIPSARSGSLGCVYEDQFYLFGGYTWKHGEYFNDLFRFNPQNNIWEKITPKTQAPPARVDHSFTIQKNLCYIFGGSNGQKRFNDLHELNLSTLEWKALSQVRQLSARLGHTITSYQNELYLFGGWDGNNTLNDLWVYSNSNGTFQTVKQQNPPAGRYRHTANVYKGFLFIFGGVDQNQERFNDLQRFDFQTSIWSRIVVQNPPSPRSFHKCVVLGNYLYLVGGFDGQRRNDVHRINLDSENGRQQIEQIRQAPHLMWIQLDLKDRFTPRTGHTACVLQNKIYLFGGVDQSGNINNDLNCFDGNSWSVIITQGQIPSARSGAKMVAVDDQLMLFGGYVQTQSQIYCNDLYRFNIKTNTFIKEIQQNTNPAKRTDHSLVEYCNGIYIFGGKGENKQIFNDVWKFKQSWIELDHDQQITGRFGHTSVPYQNSMFIFGGWDGTSCLDEMYEYSFVTNTFYEIRRCSGQKPKARYRHEALVYNSNMFLFGGVDHLQIRYNDLHQYNFKKREWIKINTSGSIPSARTFHKLVNLENQFFLLGGYDGQRLNDMYTIFVTKTEKINFTYPQEDSSILQDEEVVTLKEQVKELTNKIQREEEKHLCKICFIRQIDSVLMECCHFILCFNCTENLKNCPICRQVITRVIKTSMF